MITRILITGRNSAVPRHAFAPLAEDITPFRRDAGVRGGRNPSHPCSAHMSPAPSVQPKPPAWRGVLSCAAMMLAASCVVVGVLTVALL